jgi:hypothetical protein
MFQTTSLGHAPLLRWAFDIVQRSPLRAQHEFHDPNSNLPPDFRV